MKILPVDFSYHQDILVAGKSTLDGMKYNLTGGVAISGHLELISLGQMHVKFGCLGGLFQEFHEIHVSLTIAPLSWPPGTLLIKRVKSELFKA